MFKAYMVRHTPKQDYATVVTAAYESADDEPVGEYYVMLAEASAKLIEQRLSPGDADTDLEEIEEATRKAAEQAIRERLPESQAEGRLEWEKLDRPKLSRVWLRGLADGLKQTLKHTGDRGLRAYLSQLTSIPPVHR